MIERIHDFATEQVENLRSTLNEIRVHATVVGALAVGMATIALLETAAQKAARLRALEEVQPVRTVEDQRRAAQLARARGHAEDVAEGLVEEDPEQYEGL